MNKIHTIPLPSLRRLPRYLNILEKMLDAGKTTVSATDIAEMLDLKPIQIRKDMAFTGIVGKPKIGYSTDTLVRTIKEFLGWNQQTKAVLIGAGSLGTALTGFEGFSRRGLNIVGIFDNNERKTGSPVYGRPIRPMNEFAELVQFHEVKLGIIAVPQENAQQVADTMVEAGICGIWNFSPAEIHVPDHVVVKREDLAEGLAVLFVQMQEHALSRE
ncbi:MAG: redox-sensing transcriptional repressor Rex [Spirochaetaceae bacterium]